MGASYGTLVGLIPSEKNASHTGWEGEEQAKDLQEDLQDGDQFEQVQRCCMEVATIPGLC